LRVTTQRDSRFGKQKERGIADETRRGVKKVRVRTRQPKSDARQKRGKINCTRSALGFG